MDNSAELKPSQQEFNLAVLNGEEVSFPTDDLYICLLYTSPSPRDRLLSRMPSSA